MSAMSLWQGHTLEDFFNVGELTFSRQNEMKRESEAIHCPVVYCDIVNELVQFIYEKQDVSTRSFKLGIDGGGGFIEMALSFESLADNTLQTLTESPRRKKLSKGKPPIRTQVSKNFFFLGCVPGTPESYENLRQILALPHLQPMLFTIAGEFKRLELYFQTSKSHLHFSVLLVRWTKPMDSAWKAADSRWSVLKAQDLWGERWQLEKGKEFSKCGAPASTASPRWYACAGHILVLCNFLSSEGKIVRKCKNTVKTLNKL